MQLHGAGFNQGRQPDAIELVLAGRALAQTLEEGAEQWTDRTGVDGHYGPRHLGEQSRDVGTGVFVDGLLHGFHRAQHADAVVTVAHGAVQAREHFVASANPARGR